MIETFCLFKGVKILLQSEGIQIELYNSVFDVAEVHTFLMQDTDC